MPANFGAIEVNVAGERAIVVGMWKKGDRLPKQTAKKLDRNRRRTE
jgi:hypothetical protein